MTGGLGLAAAAHLGAAQLGPRHCSHLYTRHCSSHVSTLCLTLSVVISGAGDSCDRDPALTIAAVARAPSRCPLAAGPTVQIG